MCETGRPRPFCFFVFFTITSDPIYQVMTFPCFHVRQKILRLVIFDKSGRRRTWKGGLMAGRSAHHCDLQWDYV